MKVRGELLRSEKILTFTMAGPLGQTRVFRHLWPILLLSKSSPEYSISPSVLCTSSVGIVHSIVKTVRRTVRKIFGIVKARPLAVFSKPFDALDNPFDVDPDPTPVL